MITVVVRAVVYRPGVVATVPARRRLTPPTARTAARTSIHRQQVAAAAAGVAVATEVEAAAAEIRPILAPTTGTGAIPVTTAPPCLTLRQPRRPFN